MAGTMAGNHVAIQAATGVSMESGLDGRNNEVEVVLPAFEFNGSQWSPA